VIRPHHQSPETLLGIPNRLIHKFNFFHQTVL
jgi:hypothetical protein